MFGPTLIRGIFYTFLLLCTSHPLFAQPVLTANDFQAQTGASFQEFLAGDNVAPLPSNLSMLSTILLSDGNNDTFDFSTITAELPLFSTNYYLNLPSDSVDLPGFTAFFENKATDAWRVVFEDSSVPDVFIYRKITADSLAWLGNGVWQDSDADGIDDPIVSVFSPGKLQAPLPLALNDTWTTDFTHINTVNTPIGVVEIPGVVESHDIRVDGYGTLVTHEGSYPCLRIRINQTIQNPDGSGQELGGWSFVTADLVQLGVFYDALIPENPADISFDFEQPQSISLFGAGDNNMSTSIEDENNGLPAQFVLRQNYPNPFNPQTTIPFELRESGPVQLSIFNALGQEITTLVNQHLPAGPHDVTWEASNQPSGFYFYRLRFDGKISQQVMMLIK